MKTILYNPIFINPQAYYVFPRLTRYLQPDNESTAEPANYIGTIEVKVIAYGDTTLKRTYTNTDSIDLSEFKNTWIRISLFTKVGSCVLGEWKIGNMESDLPYIDPEVLASLKAVVIVGNKTNNDSDRAIVKNLVDPDNPFVISNAAFKLNSGFGKYEVDFTSWIQTNGVIASSDKVQNSITGRFLYFNTVNKKEDVPSFKVNITLGQQSKLQYNYIKEDGTSTYIVYSESGIYTIPASYFSKYTGGNAWFGFYQIEGTSIIEQIPSFEGAFVTDGVNDLITSTKTVQEMLGGSNEITVVSMIHLVQTPSASSEKAYTNQIRTGQNYLRNYVTNNGKTGIYGYTYKGNNVSVINNILGDKNDYTVENKSWNNLAKFSVIGYEDNGTINELDQVAWYWTIIANKVLTTDQINQVIAYFNLDRTLNPDILCNTIKQGITNENHAEFGDKLIDFSGNGRDIQLNNIAWNKESGIDDDGALRLDGVNDFGKVTGMPVYKDYTFIIDREIISIGDTNGIVASKSEYSTDVNKQGAFLFEYLGAPNNVSAWSFYKDNGKVANTDFTRGISYQSKYSYNGVELLAGTALDSDKLWLGTLRDKDSRFANVAIYSLMSFPYSMSKFLIERQLKKHKLGTLYPDMVEFRPIVKSNNKWNIIEIWQGDKSLYRPTVNDDKTGIYLKKDSTIGIYVKPYVGQKVSEIVYNGVSYTDLKLNSNGFYYRTVPVTKSPQKIGITIEQDENYVKFEPVITSNVEYKNALYYTVTNGVWTRINSGDYINIKERIAIAIFPNGIDELVSVTSSDLNNISVVSINNNGEFYYFLANLTSNSPQNINITIDEYIRYEDIDFTNCYPGVPRIYVNDKSVTWGNKLKVGDEFTFYGNVNILPEMYNVLVKALYNGEEMVYGSIGTISKSMVFTSFKTYLLDNNEPKCILSPRLLRIPNSSYKILGHIPDISGHGNHGKINNSAYEGMSGANGYPVVFGENKTWANESNGYVTSITSNTIHITNVLNAGLALLYSYVKYNGNLQNIKEIPPFKIEIKGLEGRSKFIYKYLATSDATKETNLYLGNGTHELPKSFLPTEALINNAVVGFSISPIEEGVTNFLSDITIKVLSEYEGTYCLDGVDDFVTIPTTVGGKQVLMKVNWDSPNASILYDQRGYNNEFAIYNGTNDSDGNPIPAYQGRNNGQTYIDGILNSIFKASELRAITHNITITNELSSGANKTYPIIGSSKSNAYFVNMALYDFMLFDEISTDDKILELNEYVGIEGNTE